MINIYFIQLLYNYIRNQKQLDKIRSDSLQWSLKNRDHGFEKCTFENNGL